ncbi:hypothetical protein [Zarconia navalis]|uniref:hypothetical protein n=1 Tax=Zarconia navalis TaxID=2992134 RepID=UPI0021F89D4A|nr:hypothetical protein [Zarconia navalis]
MQTSVRELRKSYWSNFVVVDYARPSIQASYLITYYPHYAQMTLEILRLLWSEFSCDREVKACFFGAGPCPELVGLTQFLGDRSPKTRTLIANIYDIAAQRWTPSRLITQNYIIPKSWRGKLFLNSEKLDFGQKSAFENIQSIVQSQKLFVFQNCFNEIIDRSILLENINFLFDNASTDSFIIIADLLYPHNLIIFEEIDEMVDVREEIEVLQAGTLRVTSSLPIPQILKNNLLTGEDGLIPRSRINFRFLALRKGDRISHNYDDIPF